MQYHGIDIKHLKLNKTLQMKLSIAYLNDVHGYLEPHPEVFFEEKRVIETAGGYSGIYSLINSFRKQNPNTLVFDGV